MPSFFAHSLIAITASSWIKTLDKPKLLVLSILCATIPDLDVLMFDLGFHYSHWLGHRGFFHSIFFAFMFALFFKMLCYRQFLWKSKKSLFIITYYTIIMVSHGILDAMTSGGRGIAFFAPFDNTRHFLPWRPIQVSPLNMDQFFGEWGIAVLQSEFIWIGIPCIVILVVKFLLRK